MASPFRTAVWLVGLCATALSAAEPAPNIAGETIEQVARRTGYTAGEIRRFFPPIRQWNAEPKPDAPASGFARGRLKAPPPPGVHPRIYFNPEDLPTIRRRLKETRVGRVQMASIRGRLLQISPKREDWQSVPYKPTDEQYRRFAQRGRRIERRMGFRGPWVGGWVNDLAAGKVPPELKGKWDQSPPKLKRQYLMHLLPFEAFRCLIDEDDAGGRRLAAALVAIARCLRTEMPRWTATSDWQRVYQLLSSDSLGLTYDWAYRWMTDEQRGVVRKTIAEIVRGKRYLGLDHLPAFPGNTSNWNIIHANLLPMALAIEGEEGYDAAVYERIVEGLRKWVYVAGGPDGAPFEGLTKSTYAPQWLLPLAKRGHAFIGSVRSLNHVRKFLLHVMLPWGGEYVFETGVGAPRNIAPFKYAYPADPVVDLVYAGTVKDLFSGDEPPRGHWPNIRTTYAPWWPYPMVAEDPIGAKNGGYDYDAALDRVMADLAKGEPLAYFSDYRGLMTARSAWRRDAAFLYFEPRHVPGGHTRASRNEFVFAAHGRLWAHRTVAVEDTSGLHSVVLIDGRGQGKAGGRCPAGRTLAYADSPLATFASADAAWAYSRVLVPADRKGARPVAESPNDSRINKSPLPWMSRPWSFLPNWATGCKPAPGRDPGGHGYSVPYNPVQYAFRTAGLVRGKHSYALIADDIRKDDAGHLCEWLMQVPNDVRLAAVTPDANAKSELFDVVLRPVDESDKRRLLLRVLEAGDGAASLAECRRGCRLETYGRERRRRVTLYRRLVLPLHAVTGTYKVLLVPFREGDKTPRTLWDKGRLDVVWRDQHDRFTFRARTDGRTTLRLRRLAPAGASELTTEGPRTDAPPD